MPYFLVKTTFIDGRRDAYTRESADGFAAVNEALTKYGDAVSCIAAMHVQQEGGNARNLPVVTVEGYTGPGPRFSMFSREPWRCAGCGRSNATHLLFCDGCGSSGRL